MGLTGDFHLPPELLAVDDELPAEHLNIGIALGERLVLPGVALTVERVRGTVTAEECFPPGDGVEQGLLPLRPHRWGPVAGLLRRRVPGGVEEERVILGYLLRDERPAVLGAGDL